ncbi:MAG: Purine nucleoside phosphoramidase [Chlamydiia bacterium]|nr:Purine nucleoside phosphoramidase [Chlamydiia bacterium]
MTTIFKKIIDKELPAEVVFENENILVIKDINPQAPIHLLIIPKKEIKNINALKAEDASVFKEIVLAAQKMAEMFNVEDYRLLTNNGKGAGQTVFHLHFHFLAGRDLGALG